MAKDFAQYKLNAIKSPVDNRDWKYFDFIKAYNFPEALDYRNLMFNVRDQGSQGSCVAMSGAAMKDYQEIIDSGLAEYMSPQFIYNNREDINEEGMYMRDLMKILSNLGDCRESLWPYGKLAKPDETAYKDAIQFKIKGYAQVNSIEDLKQALYENGPCVFAVPVYNYGNRMWKQRSGDYFLGGHAMTFVGYNSEGFIVRNSWGSDWNDDGFTIFPYEDWELQWEVWSTVDADSNDPTPPPPIPNWFEKYWYVVGGIILIAGIIFLILK